MSTTLLRCRNGHEWEGRTEHLSTESAGVVCPVCGSVERTLVTPPSLPEDRPRPGAASDPDHQPIPAVPGYEIVRELGRGGMGVVYEARELARGRLVALKVIRRERLANPDMISRFRREAQAAARLTHPNVVAVHEAGQTTLPGGGELHYLALEFVPGITLQALVEKTGPLPVALTVDLVRQIALGLQHACEQGLVHRDIKPSNLMVVAADGLPLPPRPVAKLLDMGVARLSRHLNEESLTTLTRDGAVIGTPDYIAPEQLENPRDADIRADLYSLGCTFHFLLTGDVPFPGGTLVQKLDRQRWHTALSVDHIRREVPSGVARVVRRLMAKLPDDRFDTPGELAAVLEQLQRTGELPGTHLPEPVREVGTLAGHTGNVLTLAYFQGGTALASGGADKTLRLWTLPAGPDRLRLGDGRQEVGGLTSAGGLLLAGLGVTVRGFDAAGRETLVLRGHTDAVRGLSVGPDGRLLVSCSDDRTVRTWDLTGARQIHKLAGHRDGVSGVSLSPDGRRIASAGRDQTVRLWDAGSGRELRVLAAPRGQALCVAFAPDGLTLATGHFDTTVRLWDAETGRELRRFSGHRQMVGAVAFTGEGHVISASHDQTVRIWDPASGGEVHACRGHTGPVLCLVVRPDGRGFASGSADRTVRVWELPVSG